MVFGHFDNFGHAKILSTNFGVNCFTKIFSLVSYGSRDKCFTRSSTVMVISILALSFHYHEFDAAVKY